MYQNLYGKILNVSVVNALKIRLLSTTPITNNETFYKLVIVGGGTGGISMASRLTSKLGKDKIAVIEPSEVHYYQPYWTLVGGGMKDLKSSQRPTASVMPKNVKWIKDKVIGFDPSENAVETINGLKIKYDFLIIAMGIALDFEQIEGLPEAFETPGVCSNYSPQTVNKTAIAIANFQGGNAVFTQPVNPIKCAGAPQKIMYIAEDVFNKTSRRKDANIMFFTALDVIFSAPKYAKALRRVADYKGISVNYKHSLIKVKPSEKEAVFTKLDDGSTVTVKYDILHITPPMVAPVAVKKSPLCDASGFLDVDKNTLQHTKFKNIFGIGDCTNIPTSKTAAAVAAQCGILTSNILAVMEGRSNLSDYDGYTSCPLVTGNKKGILAEFDFNLEAVETFPFDQSKERLLSFIVKRDIIPFVYWNMMLKGYWRGPSVLRKILHLGLK